MSQSPISRAVAALNRPAPQPRGSQKAQQKSRSFLHVVSIVETFTWVGLITGMAFKYVISDNGIGVTIFGWAHGVTWLVALVAIALAAYLFRWNIWVTLFALLFSALPLLILPFEIWARSTGKLTVGGVAAA